MSQPPAGLCYYVERGSDGQVHGSVREITLDELPDDEVLIEVAWSSLNYKDALAAQGHPGVARRLPHVPGIDAAGRIADSRHPDWGVGQAVLVTGYDLGAGRWGGWCRWIRVPAAWIVPLPPEMSAREAMIYGTAGFTAAQCALQLERQGIGPDSGPIVVTGASGGVGCLAIQLLHHLGYEAVASTGKSAATAWLRELGASSVVDRSDVLTPPAKPLASERWAGAVDTVGGETLASIVRATKLHGCVTACGLAGGSDLPLTVHPFILRGVTLSGVTSQNCPMAVRREIWRRLAGPWRLSQRERVVRQVKLSELTPAIGQMLAGQGQGRILIEIGGEALA